MHFHLLNDFDGKPTTIQEGDIIAWHGKRSMTISVLRKTEEGEYKGLPRGVSETGDTQYYTPIVENESEFHELVIMIAGLLGLAPIEPEKKGYEFMVPLARYLLTR